MIVHECNDKQEWDSFVQAHTGHPLQLWGWGELKAHHNWRAARFFVKDGDTIVGGAQVLFRTIPGIHRTFAYIPRGPVGDVANEAFLEALAIELKHSGAIGVVAEPDWEGDVVLPARWRKTDQTILIPQTLILDLTQSEDELLSDMAKKTRQYVHKSMKEEVVIRRVTEDSEVAACLEIYHQTAARAGFAIHDDSYYQDVLRLMGDSAPLYAAFKDDKPIAFVWLAASNTTAFELYGGMNDVGQQLRINYALKWFAITDCKRQGLRRYDLNGLLNDGISTFKRGFAHHENTLIGTIERPLSPLYTGWTTLLPVAKKINRLLHR